VKNRISDIVTTVVTARIAIIACLLVAVATACGERPEPLGEVPESYPVTVAGAGERPTVVAELPERIVALDPGSAELLLALGTRDRLLGVPAGVRRGAGPLTARPDAAEVVSRTMDVQVDEIVKLKPDLIVATPATDLLDVSRAQRETKAAVYLQPNVSIDGVLRAALELGIAVGEPVAGRTIASRIRSQVALVEDRLATEPKVTTFVDRGFFITIPERSLFGDLVTRGRGTSIAGDDPGVEPYSLARLRRADPDVYIATSDSHVTLQSLREDPRTRNLTAVKKGNFAIVSSDLVNRAGPRVGRALQQVAKALHPDAFRR
jgi:iron complex transport system substrate-binding protein